MDLFDILLVKKLVEKANSGEITSPEVEQIMKQLEEKASKDKCYALLTAIKTAEDKYNNDTFKYNKRFIIDDLILTIWRIINGH